MVDEGPASDDDTEICVAEWADLPKGKVVACTFLKPGPQKNDEICCTFDVSKCDKLFDMLL
jgi:hypothetical protein